MKFHLVGYCPKETFQQDRQENTLVINHEFDVVDEVAAIEKARDIIQEYRSKHTRSELSGFRAELRVTKTIWESIFRPFRPDQPAISARIESPAVGEHFEEWRLL